MKFDLKPQKIDLLVKAFIAGSISRNPEYQRGAAWNRQQKQSLIDSIFREYPLPAIFLEVKLTIGLEEEPTKKYEIIDGQQRLLAIREFVNDDFELLSSNDAKLRLPFSMRGNKGEWEGKRFSGLSKELQDKFLEKEVQSYLVQEVANPDEVRDLFIRLQSGTALTRQQIRDAWPGVLGPRIEVWAGKIQKTPRYTFLDAVDGRGTRDEEDDPKDPYVKHRTTCAQLCQLLLSRAENPYNTSSIKASDLDGLYHKYTSVTNENNPLDEIEEVFKIVQNVIDRLSLKESGRRKISKIALFALSMFVQDVRRGGNLKLTAESLNRLAKAVAEPKVAPSSRGFSGKVIKEFYELWRSHLPEGTGVELDSRRAFTEEQKLQIFNNSAGVCGECGEQVLIENAEYDHFPHPYRDGGRTEVSNGRLVHQECHPRGRPRKTWAI